MPDEPYKSQSVFEIKMRFKKDAFVKGCNELFGEVFEVTERLREKGFPHQAETIRTSVDNIIIDLGQKRQEIMDSCPTIIGNNILEKRLEQKILAYDEQVIENLQLVLNTMNPIMDRAFVDIDNINDEKLKREKVGYFAEGFSELLQEIKKRIFVDLQKPSFGR